MSENASGPADAPAQSPTPAEGQPPVAPAQPPYPPPATPAPASTAKVFSFQAVKRVIEVAVHWPSLYPDFQHWVFKLRLALSKEAQGKREDWLAMPAGQGGETEKFREEALTELCDLLTDLPTGFGDLAAHGTPGQDPGSVFRNYVTAASNADAEIKETVYKIVEAAINGYWARVSPREFREAVPTNRS